MKWQKQLDGWKIPVKSWCGEIEDEALRQAANLARHPALAFHVALMPDCHSGYGMPIGGVIACDDAIIPNAVGVDIGCGMVAVKTNFPAASIGSMERLRSIAETIKKLIPAGEAHSHNRPQEWEGFERFRDSLETKTPAWLNEKGWKLDQQNLGTLGGGNHFIEIQKGDDGLLWLMIHSGSRNLGYRIAACHHAKAKELDAALSIELPSSDLAFLPASGSEGKAYERDMNFALAYALENRRRMMQRAKEAVSDAIPGIEFSLEVNIHHNYAALERHFGHDVWVHRKGATSAQNGEWGIIPGSMGTPSYIVKGTGNPESFMSCSHGAGRKMGRKEACRTLSVEACNKAMEGIVFDRWSFRKNKKDGKVTDLSEAPLAYKDIEEVISSELDLINPQVKLLPMAVVKG